MKHAFLFAALSLVACGSPMVDSDAGGPPGNDAGQSVDDGGTMDAGQQTGDAGQQQDAGVQQDAGTPFVCLSAPGPASPQGVTARAIVADGGRLVDVRTEAEYAAEHIACARNIPLQVLPARLGELQPTDEWVVVYCRSGNRSAQAAAILTDGGFTKVFDLGPMTNW